jgi:hypothetical protein
MSNYDEKIMSEMTLYGLPMQGISLPSPQPKPAPTGLMVTTYPSVDFLIPTLEIVGSKGEDLSATAYNLELDYEEHFVPGMGSYFRIAGSPETYVSGGRPIQPLASLLVDQDGKLAHGVLMTGGEFSEFFNDPVISRVVTDTMADSGEAPYNIPFWFPAKTATINRFLSMQTGPVERLVVVPGQFMAMGEAEETLGYQRLYDSLSYIVYHAPFTDTDFIAPSIWEVDLSTDHGHLEFSARVGDDSGQILRTLVLYRLVTETQWRSLDLAFDPTTGWATGVGVPLSGLLEYFVQAVDPSGNVSLGLDKGNPFSEMVDLHVENDSPFFTSIPVSLAYQGKAYTYAITTADPDSGDTLQLSAPVLPDWLVFTLLGDGAGLLSGTPGNEHVGGHPVTLVVQDSQLVTVTQQFTITVIDVNETPTLDPIGSFEVNEAGAADFYRHRI